MTAYDIRYHDAHGQYFLYIPAGTDPADGAPLTYATPLLAAEAILYRSGQRRALEQLLRQRGIPVPGPDATRAGKWKRFKAWLKKQLLGGIGPV